MHTFDNLKGENVHDNATTVDSNVIFASNHLQTLAKLYFHTEMKRPSKKNAINIFFLMEQQLSLSVGTGICIR